MSNTPNEQSPGASPGYGSSGMDTSLSEEETSFSMLDAEQQEQILKRQNNRRKSICAESIKESDIAKFQKKVFHKSAEEMIALRNALDNESDCIMFRYMDEDTRSDVFDCMEPKAFKGGEVIITQGDEGDYFYLITKGNVDVIKDGKKECTLHSGDFFGELALLHNAPRNATCIVPEGQEVTTYRLDRTSFNMLVKGNSLKKRKMYEEWLRKINLLESLSDKEVLTLVDALKAVTYKHGDMILNQGEVGNDFFIIVSGEAEVYQKKDPSDEADTHVDTLKTGQYFGEVALILHRPRAATVKAKGKLECVKVDKKTFERILGPCQEIMRRNMSSYKSLIDFYSQ